MRRILFGVLWVVPLALMLTVVGGILSMELKQECPGETNPETVACAANSGRTAVVRSTNRKASYRRGRIVGT